MIVVMVIIDMMMIMSMYKIKKYDMRKGVSLGTASHWLNVECKNAEVKLDFPQYFSLSIFKSRCTEIRTFWAIFPAPQKIYANFFWGAQDPILVQRIIILHKIIQKPLSGLTQDD